MEVLKLHISSKEMTDRFKRLVTQIIKENDVDEVAQNLGCTTVELMEGSPSLLGRDVIERAKQYYKVSLLWIWTGQGPKFTRK